MLRRVVLVALVLGSFVAAAIPGTAAASSRGKPASCESLLGYRSYLGRYGDRPGEVVPFLAKMQQAAPGSLKKDVRVLAKAAKAAGAKPFTRWGRNWPLFAKAVFTAEKHVDAYISKHCT